MSNRTHKGRGVSLPPEMFSDVEKRLGGLQPWVSSFSSYVQRLINMDLNYGLLETDGGINETVVKKEKGKRPFNQPLTPFGNGAVVG